MIDVSKLHSDPQAQLLERGGSEEMCEPICEQVIIPDTRRQTPESIEEAYLTSF
jgi:hypothetical protein